MSERLRNRGYRQFEDEHQLFRKTVRDWCLKELRPHVDEWEEVTEDFLNRKYEEIRKRFGIADGPTGIDFIRAAPPLSMSYHVDRINRVIAEAGALREPVALDLAYLERYSLPEE